MTTEFRYDGRRLLITLPQVGEAITLWMHPQLRTAEYAHILRTAEIHRFTRTPDTKPIDRELAGAILDNPRAYAAYRVARDAELVAATEGGTIFAECPHCRAWEADLAPLALAVALRSEFWPLVDGPDLAVPALACDLFRDVRGNLTSQLTMQLPEHHDHRASFQSNDALERLRLWTTASAELFQQSAVKTEDWTPDSPGWWALLRFAGLVPAIAGQPTVEGLLALTRLPLTDFLFADNVYYLTHAAPLPEDNIATLRCRACGHEFLPLARSCRWTQAAA
jgi:hypothetical protein